MSVTQLSTFFISVLNVFMLLDAHGHHSYAQKSGELGILTKKIFAF